ncbi:MAG: toll/interleukin-1 receptor domain-containing protein [Chthoniobacterales bacterium]|nr:toll/interleukin-1 receptor domain-containing protein [Chthoniobacterales bacterium]
MSCPVFISYCNEDAPVAEAVCGALEQAGIRCWIAPRDVQPGENWGRSIIKAIAGSKLMVLVFSGHTNTSRHVNNEIERAVSHRITILPFRIEKVQPSEDLELFISSCHWLDAYTPPLDAKISQLVSAVRGVVSGEPAAAAAKATSPAGPAGTGKAAKPASLPGINKGPVIAGAAALLIAITVVAFYFLRPATDEPAGATGIAQTVPPAAQPPQKAEKEPSKAEQRPAPAEEGVAKAKKAEDAQDFIGALADYSRILSRDKDNKDARARAENVIARLEETSGDKPASYRLLDILNDLSAMNLTRASTFLGKLLRTSDPAESVKLFRAAAGQGDRSAMVEAGFMVASGHGVDRPDYEEAAMLFKKASDAGSADGMRLYADCLLDGIGVEVNEPEAARLYSSSMALGNTSARSRLAMLYRSGRGMPAPDPATAFKLFEEAAQDGFLEAQGNLGVMYMNGETVPADSKKAVRLWKEGAEKGDEICMVFYATALENGAVGEPDVTAAKEWYRKAARMRNAKAIDWCVKNGVTF